MALWDKLFGRKRRRELSSELLKASAYSESNQVTLRIRELLAGGADADSIDEEMETPLMKAAWASNLHAMKLLVAAGAKIDCRNWEGKTPLMASAISGNVAALDILVHAGANLYECCDSGCTAGYYALLTQHHEAAGVLRKAEEYRAEADGIQLIEPPLCDVACVNCGGSFNHYVDGEEIDFGDGRDLERETLLCARCGNKARFRMIFGPMPVGRR
ncbi:MAG TPA: ankyrin repeat domain-containing protein [Thermoanaerobaculia bacterium]|nr:ankyrin repeat domain-containing protein [Thermoanaerobaculia bacterium]